MNKMEGKSSNLSLFFIVFNFAIIMPFSLCEFTSKHYGEALSKSFLYLEAQRSGHLPHNQRVLWRYHSAVLDGLEQGVCES